MTGPLAPDLHYLALVPIGLPVLFGLLLLVWDILLKKDAETELYFLAIAGFGITGLSLLLLMGRPVPSVGRFLTLDRFSMVCGELFVLAGLLTLLISYRYLKTEKLNSAEFYALILFAVSGMMLLVSATELITFFLGLELMALSIYLLTGYHLHNYLSNEASMKYFLMGILSSSFLLMSMSLLFGFTGKTGIFDIASAITRSGVATNPALLLAMLMFLVAFAFKVSVFPFHVWTPDAYEGAPSPITAFMSVAPKTAALAAMIRIFVKVFGASSHTWILALAVMAVMSMIFGNVVAVTQRNVKRLLAYSTIAHAGYIMLGLVAYQITPNVDGLPDGITAILFYMFTYAFANIGAFSVIILLGKEGGSGSKIEDYAGLAYRHPFAAFAMTVFLLSLTGIPLTAGFIGKVYLFGAVISAGPPFLWLAVIGVITSVVALYYYMKIVMYMYMRESTQQPDVLSDTSLMAAMAVCVAGVFFLGLFPQSLMEWIRESVRIMLL